MNCNFPPFWDRGPGSLVKRYLSQLSSKECTVMSKSLEGFRIELACVARDLVSWEKQSSFV